MNEKIEELKKKMSKEKNKEMDQRFDQITEQLEQLIGSNRVESIFDISDEFDKLIKDQEGATV